MSIDGSAFEGCTSLENIVAGENSNFEFIDGGLYSKDRKTLICVVKDIEEFVISNNIVEIGEHAFVSCKCLKSISIPDGVIKIGDCAFKDCMALEKIDIPNSVKVIGIYAFCCCELLREISLPPDIKDYGLSKDPTYEYFMIVHVDGKNTPVRMEVAIVFESTDEERI